MRSGGIPICAVMADDRVCQKCGRRFRYPRDLKRHLDRKTPCCLIVDRQAPSDAPSSSRCHFCGRSYSGSDALRRHIRTACKIAPNERNGEKGMDLLYEHVKRQQARLDEQAAEIEILRKTAAAPAGGNLLVVNQDNRGQVNVHQEIHLNIFGSESTAHLTPGAVKRLLDEAKAMEAGPAAQLALLRAAEALYSDPSHPENITCFLPNKKTKEALVHGEKGWEIRPEAAILPAIAQKSHTALFDAQPLPCHEGCEAMVSHKDYEHIFKELLANEAAFSKGVLGLHEMLVRNKTLVAQVLGALPQAAS